MIKGDLRKYTSQNTQLQREKEDAIKELRDALQTEENAGKGYCYLCTGFSEMGQACTNCAIFCCATCKRDKCQLCATEHFTNVKFQ